MRIFKEVALKQSFTKASEHLFISQPAVSKAVKSLEEEYKTAFFIRKGNNIQLTTEGKTFLNYANRILEIYTEMEDYFLNLENQMTQRFVLGASSTLTQYVLPKIIAKVQKESPQYLFEIRNGNTEQIEHLVGNQEIDFGIIEGSNSNILLKYEPFVKDEIVLVTSVNNKELASDIVGMEKLKELPIVEREVGSGTREIIYQEFAKHGLKKLNSSLILSSTEAIKHYLYDATSHYALLSIHAIYKELAENKLKVIEIEGVNIERWFYFVTRQGFQSKKMQYFKRLATLSYNF